MGILGLKVVIKSICYSSIFYLFIFFYKTLFKFIFISLQQREWAWSLEPLKGQSKILGTMNRGTYRTIRKHFRVFDQRGLPDRDDPNYHLLQNISQGLLYLRDKSREVMGLWKKMSIG